MKSAISYVLSTVILASGTSVLAAESFSAKKWEKNVTAAFEDADAEKLVSLLNWADLRDKTWAQKDAGDKKQIAEARELYAKEKFEEAIAAYDKIPKGSDYWLEAVEEKGWAFHRQKTFNKTLAQTKTLLSPVFLPIVGAEPFFLQSLSQLKICDYKGVLETHKLFKTSQKARMAELQNISSGTTVPKIDKLVGKANTFPLVFKEMGEDAKLLPRLFYRDAQLQKALFVIKVSQIIAKIDSSDISSANMRTLRDQTNVELKAAAAKAYVIAGARLQKLADVETDENIKMLQKLNLIEIETIQRVHTDRDLNKNAYHRGEFKKATTEDLVFPDDGRPWMDELDKYQVKVNSCPQNIRRMM